MKPEELKRLQGKAIHVHISDCDGKVHGDLPPGRGVMNFAPYLHEVRELGIDGAISIELEYSPEPDKIAELKKIEEAQMKAFGYLLKAFQSVNETGGTLLDRTQILYGSCLGNANSHSNQNLPLILAGGGLKHGQHLAFDTTNNTPVANLFVSMLQNLGIEANKFSSSTGTMNGV